MYKVTSRKFIVGRLHVIHFERHGPAIKWLSLNMTDIALKVLNPENREKHEKTEEIVFWAAILFPTEDSFFRQNMINLIWTSVKFRT